MFDHMTIKEIAKICHCSTRTLRYYEEIGLLKPKRMENNYRIYSFDVVSRVEMIQMLKKTGMQLEQIKRELSNYRNPEELLATQKRFLEEEKKRIDRTIDFIDNQHRMFILYQKYGLGKLFLDERYCSDYEIVRRVEREEIVIRMVYDDIYMAIEDCDDPDIYMVKKKETGTNKHIAAVFLSGEHRIRHRKKLFTELVKRQGYSCQSLIYSESYCLMDDADIYFMWCEIAA